MADQLTKEQRSAQMARIRATANTSTEAKVEFAGGVCKFRFEVPASEAASVDLGQISCTEMLASAQ